MKSFPPRFTRLAMNKRNNWFPRCVVSSGCTNASRLDRPQRVSRSRLISRSRVADGCSVGHVVAALSVFRRAVANDYNPRRLRRLRRRARLIRFVRGNVRSLSFTAFSLFHATIYRISRPQFFTTE